MHFSPTRHLQQHLRGPHSPFGLVSSFHVLGVLSSLHAFFCFGAQIETVTGLVPASELSWMDLEQPCDMVASGQQLQAVITSVNLPLRRVQLSVRQAARSPLGTFREPASHWRREPSAAGATVTAAVPGAPPAQRSSQELTESAIKLRAVRGRRLRAPAPAALH